MKITSFRGKEPKFTADLWTYKTGTDSTGAETRVFLFNRKITFNAVTGNFGKTDIFLAESEADVRAFHQFYNFYGPDGNEMMLNGIYQVEMISPFINIWGHREGFRARIAYIGYDGDPNATPTPTAS